MFHFNDFYAITLFYSNEYFFLTDPTVEASLSQKLCKPISIVLTCHAGLQVSGW